MRSHAGCDAVAGFMPTLGTRDRCMEGQEKGGREKGVANRSIFVVKISKRTFHFNPFYVAVDFAIKQLNLLTANL